MECVRCGSGWAVRSHVVGALCGRCREEAPRCGGEADAARWLRATTIPLPGSYWVFRGEEEFAAQHGRPPLDWVRTTAVDEGAVRARYAGLLRTALAEVAARLGEGALIPSTIAVLIAGVERELAVRHRVLLSEDSALSADARFRRSLT
ncbi:hypothetical protein [Actinosynnema sp. NPDC020468]|uniref:hypothetical protein n=1 Tax=Actinosynnema sp. NPDC020468 TaxID=3154488 RepID=UPI003402D619